MNVFGAVLKLKEKPGGSYTAVSYDQKKRFLSTYVISNEAEDPEYITIWYEGGVLFDDEEEEEGYGMDDLPVVVKTLKFKPSSEYPDTSGYVAEYTAHMLFPELPDPDTLVCEKDGRAFALKLGELSKR